jgi:probable HAF family extracellular repeat protein
MLRSRFALVPLLALFALGLGYGPPRPDHPDGYTVTDLGILPGKTATVIYGTHALTNAGQTAGFCNLGTIDNGLYADFFLGNVGFLWTQQNSLQQLTMLPGAAVASGWSLNDQGQVVGVAGNTPTDSHAVLWEKASVRDLGTLPADNASFAYAINNRGQIVGASYLVNGDIYSRATPVLWDKGQLLILPTGNYPGGRATAMNEKGQVAGVVQTSEPVDFFFASLPALWIDGNLTVLGTLGGDFGSAWDINQKGQVVGYSQAADGTIHGFIWEKGVMTDPGTRGGFFTALYAVNNKGQAVGESYDADEVDHAILIDNGEVIDLNDRIAADSGWVLLFCSGINERGQICGTGFLNGEVRGFLLTPTKAP